MRHRNPPPLPRRDPHKGRGWCWFCGEQITAEQRKRPKLCTWHLECVEVWSIATGSNAMRNALSKRDNGVCAQCGEQASNWEADHVVPLYRAPREWRYWGLENLQTLCRPCHLAKCAEEARERAQDSVAPAPQQERLAL